MPYKCKSKGKNKSKKKNQIWANMKLIMSTIFSYKNHIMDLKAHLKKAKVLTSKQGTFPILK
jgi:hypothetical protein